MNANPFLKSKSIVIGGESYKIAEIQTYSSRLDVYSLLSETDENIIALKLKLKTKKERADFFEAKKKEAIVKEFLSDHPLKTVVIPSYEVITDEWVLTPYAGEPLSDQYYKTLSPKQKDSIQQSLAEILNYIHQKSLSCKDQCPNVPYKETIGRTGDYIKGQNILHTFEYAMKIFAPYASDKLKNELKQLFYNFQNRDTSDEVSVLLHNDLCQSNVLYNPKTNKTALIDFECSEVGNVYNDFCHYVGLYFPKDFMLGVIKKYNVLTKKSSHPLPISLKKLEMLWELAALDCQARWVQRGERPPEDAFKKFITWRKKIRQKVGPMKQNGRG